MFNQAALSSPEQDTRAVAHALQRVLVDLIDLSLIGKHAHWNVRGPNFLALHRQFDELVEDWRQLSDDVAERIAALGFAPDGQLERVAEQTRLEPLAAGPLDAGIVTTFMSVRLTAVIVRARDARHEVEPSDPVTADLLSHVLLALEKHRWLLRAQQDSPQA